MAKLLLHTCCGPCFLGSWESLKESGIDIYNFWFNPNIQPEAEHQKRLANLKKAANRLSKEIIIKGYEPRLHLAVTEGQRSKLPERCFSCYELRLAETAKTAKKEGFDFFSTTLLVSPYQNHDALKGIAAKISEKEKIAFYYFDFRPHFREGQRQAAQKNIYRQKYCGCFYSRNYK